MSKKLVWDTAELARKLAAMRVVDRDKTPPVVQNQRFSRITGSRLTGGHQPPVRKNRITLPPIWKK